MNFLLDTHIALWTVEDNPRLPRGAREALLRPDAVIFVGVVSLWEIAIKHALGRNGADAIPVSAHEARSDFQEAGYTLLPIKPDHVAALENLPKLHRDPFDRLLVATALSEPLRLVTHDARLAAYSDAIMVV